MPRKKPASFDEIAEKLITAIGTKIEGVDKKINIENMDFVATYTMTPEQKTLGIIAFHHTIYEQFKLTGDVMFFAVDGPYREKPTHVIVGCFMECRQGEPVNTPLTDINGIKYIIRRTFSSVSTYYGKTLSALFLVPRDTTLKNFIVPLEDENEVSKAVLASARVAKSLAKALVPVFSIDGDLIDVSIVGNEDIIFSHILTHELMLIRSRRMGFREDRRE